MSRPIFRGLLQQPTGGGGGLGPFTSNKTITIDHTKCGSADTTDYPFLFKGTYTYLKSTGNGGSVTSGSGYDIVPFSDSGRTTMLDFELESWDATTGAIEMWVRIPTLTFASDKVIYLGAGNASITTSQQNVTGTWASSYKGVWHLGDGVNNYNTAMRADSTANGLTLGNVGAVGVAAAGIVRGGLSKNGSGDGLWTTSVAAKLLTAFTIEVWAKPSSFGGYRTMLSKGFGSACNYKLLTNITTGAPAVQMTIGGVAQTVLAPSALSTGAFSHVCGTWDGSTLTLYVNGASVGTPVAVSGTADDTGAFNIGALDQNSDPMAGLLDEARIQNTARSASYALATYNNVSSPSTFYAVT